LTKVEILLFFSNYHPTFVVKFIYFNLIIMKSKNKEVVSSGIAYNAFAPGTLIKGSIHAEEDFRIDGRVEGLIECAGKVVIGPQGEIEGDIHCANVDIIGRVTGNLIIKEVLSVKSSGVFTGELVTNSLEIEAGATINGTCKVQQ
jgi:cytoskeletal protein CcmA (bactofilin family)